MSRGRSSGCRSLDHHRDRVRDADGVGDLDLGAVGETGRDEVLGDPARRVGGRAVDLDGTCPERAAAVAGDPAVGVDDDIAPGQAGVADGAAMTNGGSG